MLPAPVVQLSFIIFVTPPYGIQHTPFVLELQGCTFCSWYDIQRHTTHILDTYDKLKLLVLFLRLAIGAIIPADPIIILAATFVKQAPADIIMAVDPLGAFIIQLAS